ncbi:FISUMP domain-containing protein [Saccharicrinis sp. FJH2]|uniref:FISUMP domain-containing protein n=1 Tax=Saccharicrinis sp. FJH65 TaxID=3344659 RepID=UPI0035F4C716
MMYLKKGSELLSLTVAISLLVLVSCEKDKNVNNSSQDGISDYVVLVDDLSPDLLSDSAQLAEGIYIFQFDADPPDFSAGDILLSQQGSGYLRKVLGSEKNGNSVTLKTEQATLEDLYENSTVSFSLPVNSDLKSATINNSKHEYIAQGVQRLEGDGINLNITNVEFKVENGNENINLKIANGTVNIIPNFQYMHDISGWNLNSVKLTSYNTAINFETNVSISGASKGASLKKEVPIFETITVTPFGVLVVEVLHKVYLKFESSANIGLDYNYHSVANYTCDFGAIYENDEFNPFYELTSDNYSVVNNSLGVQVGGEIKLSLVYEPTFYVYAVKGPYVENSAYGEIKGGFSTADTRDWDLSMGFGAASKIGLNYTIFKKNLLNVSKTFQISKKDIYVTPYEMEMVDNTIQSLSIFDPVSVKVRVLSNMGSGVANVRVYFVPETGSGTTADEFVLTDGEGIAETIWTPADDEDVENVLDVYARKADGSYIKNAPLKFTVEDYFTDERDGHTYRIVKIGNQVWMAENLAYLPTISPPNEVPMDTSNHDPYYTVYDYYGTSVSNAKATEMYKKYGVLYNAPAAFTACPDGWHLPSNAEWEELANLISADKGGERTIVDEQSNYTWSNIGKYLKSVEGWGTGISGIDTYGFSVLSAGYRLDSEFYGLGKYAKFWEGSTSNFNDPVTGSWWFFNNDLDLNGDDIIDVNASSVYVGRGGHWSDGLSIRCVRD